MIDLSRVTLRILIIPTCLFVSALPGAAQDLAWPDGAEMVRAEPATAGRLQVATGPFAGGTVPTDWLEGAVSEQIWHLPGGDLDTAALSGRIREQLTDAGFDIRYSCQDRQCGGFDFRYALPIAEEPDMHVDLGNFQYISAVRFDDDGATHAAVTLSRGGRQGYAHVAVLQPADAVPPRVTQSTRLPSGALPAEDLATRLLDEGRAVLADLNFETGASALTQSEYRSLADLADFLLENPSRRIVLVGHTDAQGGLDRNIALSEARARAVRQALLTDFGVDPTQITARGIGFLAPQAANSTEDGRNSNRRVEAVLAGIE